MTDATTPASPTGGDEDILFGVSDGVGHILLNRPKALNALTRDMCLRMRDQLERWEEDDRVACVLVEGAGEKGFCAGGDIRALYDSGREKTRYALDFYHDEYQLNRLIKRYPKPYVALIDGITMGGGVGISVHGSHRVAGERTVFAMPETGIGLFPDVGGSYFLPRLPGETGTYLALTGARLKAADCLDLGIATHRVESARTDDLKERLKAATFGADPAAAVDLVLNNAAPENTGEAAPLSAHRTLIDACFAKDSVEEILAALEADGSDFAAETVKTLRTKSPTSLKLTLRQMREGAGKDYEDCARMEYRMVHGIYRGHDFYEGVRAVIIDKDNAPAWRPDSLEAVSDADIAAYFDGEGVEDIRFP